MPDFAVTDLSLGETDGQPDALSNVRGAFAQRRCQVGVRPSSTALPSRPGRKPQPSSTIRTTGCAAHASLPYQEIWRTFFVVDCRFAAVDQHPPQRAS